jgi:two-component system, NtrC family, response regulator AlgB
MATILIVDDEKNIRTHLATYVRSLGHVAETAEDARAALGLVGERPFDVVFSDVRMAGMDGLALLHEIRRRRPETVVVIMTAYATVPQAVEAMRAGAYDYLAKPFSLEEVGALLGRVLEVQGLRHENRRLRRVVDEPALLESGSPPMQRALVIARQVAASDATILLTGESGTGKNVLAKAMHGWSARAAGPFVTIACTTLAEHLLESELFGHVKGAFTGAWKDKPGRLAAAADGTVFLDEVGELPPELQAKLLRFLEEHRFEPVGGGETITVDARIIAATNRDLEADVRAGRFREDLFFRLNVIEIRLPPLRERLEDLPALVDHLLAGLRARHHRGPLTLAPEARAALAAYRWPGNVRELVNVLERAIVLSRGDVLRAEDLPDRLLAPEPSAVAAPAPTHLSLEDVERRHIEAVLADSGTLEEAAARLGINATTLWRKRRRWGIE